MNNCPRVQTRTGFDVGEPQVQTPVRALASACAEKTEEAGAQVGCVFVGNARIEEALWWFVGT